MEAKNNKKLWLGILGMLLITGLESGCVRRVSTQTPAVEKVDEVTHNCLDINMAHEYYVQNPDRLPREMIKRCQERLEPDQVCWIMEKPCHIRFADTYGRTVMESEYKIIHIVPKNYLYNMVTTIAKCANCDHFDTNVIKDIGGNMDSIRCIELSRNVYFIHVATGRK